VNWRKRRDAALVEKHASSISARAGQRHSDPSHDNQSETSQATFGVAESEVHAEAPESVRMQRRMLLHRMTKAKVPDSERQESAPTDT
jgi:hypothetical protein